MPVDRTHDISSASYHVKDVQALGKVLTEAGNAAFPNRGRSRYKEAHVLLLSWEDDDLGVIDEVNDLQDVFRQSYNYETEVWKIPGTRSHNSLATRILQLLADHEARDSLLIVYYGGHGLMNDDRQCIWSWSVPFHLLELLHVKRYFKDDGVTFGMFWIIFHYVYALSNELARAFQTFCIGGRVSS